MSTLTAFNIRESYYFMPKLRILIVDDEGRSKEEISVLDKDGKLIRRSKMGSSVETLCRHFDTAHQLLRIEDVEIVVATNEKEVQTSLDQSGPFDAILMDNSMPEKNGAAMTRTVVRFWEKDKCPPQLVVGWTSNANDQKVVDEMEAAGVNLVLPKANHLNQILSLVAAIDFLHAAREEISSPSNLVELGMFNRDITKKNEELSQLAENFIKSLKSTENKEQFVVTECLIKQDQKRESLSAADEKLLIFYQTDLLLETSVAIGVVPKS